MPFAVVVVTSTAVASRRATLTPTQGCGMFDQSAGETCIPFVVFGRVHVDIMSTDATHNGLFSKSLDHHLLCLVTAEMAYDDDTVEIRPSPSAARRAVKRPHLKLFFVNFVFFVFVFFAAKSSHKFLKVVVLQKLLRDVTRTSQVNCASRDDDAIVHARRRAVPLAHRSASYQRCRCVDPYERHLHGQHGPSGVTPLCTYMLIDCFTVLPLVALLSRAPRHCPIHPLMRSTAHNPTQTQTPATPMRVYVTHSRRCYMVAAAYRHPALDSHPLGSSDWRTPVRRSWSQELTGELHGGCR
jgi:hypothetical protein